MRTNENHMPSKCFLDSRFPRTLWSWNAWLVKSLCVVSRNVFNPTLIQQRQAFSISSSNVLMKKAVNVTTFEPSLMSPSPMPLRINNTPLSVLKSMFCIINGKVHMQIKVFFFKKIKRFSLYTPLELTACERRHSNCIFGRLISFLIRFSPLVTVIFTIWKRGRFRIFPSY